MWMLPDLEAKAQHYKNSPSSLHLNNYEAKHEQKVNFNIETNTSE